MPRWLPNILTSIRILLTPFIAWSLGGGKFGLAAWLLVAASVTDFLDGRLARNFGLRTPLGERLDPIADKFLLVAVFLALGWVGLFPLWLVALVIGRDILIVAAAGWAMIFTNIRSFPPTWSGKVSTTFQMTGAVCVIAAQLPGLGVFDFLRPVAVIAIAIATLWSLVDYLFQGMRLLKANSKPGRVDGGQRRG